MADDTKKEEGTAPRSPYAVVRKPGTAAPGINREALRVQHSVDTPDGAYEVVNVVDGVLTSQPSSASGLVEANGAEPASCSIQTPSVPARRTSRSSEKSDWSDSAVYQDTAPASLSSDCTYVLPEAPQELSSSRRQHATVPSRLASSGYEIPRDVPVEEASNSSSDEAEISGTGTTLERPYVVEDAELEGV